jgi:glutathione synthase/RimK-type ligase-like ATP-grasp enzyme
VVIDVTTFETTPYALSGDALTLDSHGLDIRVLLRAPMRGWIRRLAPPLWRPGVTLGSEEAAIRGAWTSFVAAVAGSANVVWLTPLERLFLRENKVLQVEIAQRLGIPTPPTVVCSHRDLIPSALGDELVVKPLGRAQYTDAGGTEQVVWTREINRDSQVLDLLAGAPFIVQARLHAERHLRVVTVRDQCWLCELPADELPIDWRRNEAAHDAFVAAEDHDVERHALRVAEALGVGYSSQDWIVSDGVAHFIDLNPAGQWLFLPEPAGSDITSAVAKWLTP